MRMTKAVDIFLLPANFYSLLSGKMQTDICSNFFTGRDYFLFATAISHLLIHQEKQVLLLSACFFPKIKKKPPPI